MVLNYIWIAFFVIAFIIALIKVIFLGDTEIFTAIMNSTFDSSKTAFEISLEQRTNQCTRPLSESGTLPPVSGHSQRASGIGFHLHEYVRQYARAR